MLKTENFWLHLQNGTQILDFGEFITVHTTARGFLIVSQTRPRNILLHQQLLSCRPHVEGGNNKEKGLRSRPLQSMGITFPGVLQRPTCAGALFMVTKQSSNANAFTYLL